jgi:hypothetical protein
MTRREFLSAAGAAGCVFAGPYQRAAKALAKKVKITDVKCMIVRGTWTSRASAGADAEHAHTGVTGVRVPGRSDQPLANFGRTG